MKLEGIFTRKTAKSILVNILIFVTVVYAVHLYQTRNSPTGVAPEIKGYMLNGEKFEGLDKLKKPVLVHFWATWCKVCKLEHDNISSIASDYTVVGIASQSGSLSDVKAYVKDHEISYPVMLDANGYNARQWNIIGFPTSFIIAEDNKITFTEVGFTSEIGVRIRLWLATW